MEKRADYTVVAPGVLKSMIELEKYIHSTGLDGKLLNLVKTRASQINGCVWCLDMHTKDAIAGGEEVQKLLLLPAWKECSLYNDKEKATLAYTESVTLLSQNGVPDEVYNSVKKYFREEEIANLTLAIISINGWNRLNVAFGNSSCTYIPGQHN